jgi:hypothetical protein
MRQRGRVKKSLELGVGSENERRGGESLVILTTPHSFQGESAEVQNPLWYKSGASRARYDIHEYLRMNTKEVR